MSSRTRSSRVSPLKGRPLRTAGQSLAYELDDLLVREILFPTLVILLMLFLIGMEWWRWYHPQPPEPISMTVLGGLVSAGAAALGIRGWKRARALELGLDGERAVAELLDKLRERGARVFHDIQGPKFNLDHVVLAPQGVFVIETKTWRKPSGREVTISFDGTELRAAGYRSDRAPIAQATALAAWLSQVLEESTGKTYPARPVVLFPGWFVEPVATANAKALGAWLLSGRELPAFIANEPERLAIEDLKLAAYHLSRYIRTTRA